ncbi:hypothetical protein Aoki45_28380 [Algoriphagus sp. oki45]|uniref:hypothetical protein n=1 Tax=Algoriphagus sp. oki45 TaxID=3067294 RepID=UPI0027FB23E5|nr:hypothetical protein Aoki45_28380 [Algoriphagus sp. oki45]
MKEFLKAVLLVMLLAPIYSHAQFSTKTKVPSNATVKPGTNLSKTSNLTLTKTTLQQVQAIKLDKSLSSIPKIQLNPEDIERNRVKSWEITPTRPITSGMDLSFTGNYSKDAFYVRPILVGESNNLRFYQALNLTLITSMVVDKDFRFTIELENPNEFPRGAEILVSLGGLNYLLKPEPGKKEIYFLFRNTTAAPQFISIGPAVIQEDWQNPKGYGISKLRLEELAPAQ